MPVLVPRGVAAAFVELAIRDATRPPDDAYAAHRARYRDDSVGWARDCIDWPDGEGLTDYQAAIMGDVLAHKRAAARGPHGIGKSTIEALLIHWFALTRDMDTDWKIPTTAGAWRQLTHYLWPEVHKWAARIRWSKVGRAPYRMGDELLQLGLRLSTGAAFAAAAKDSALIEGAHASSMLYLFDEAKTVGDPIWDAAEGAFATPSADLLALAVSTPGESAGRFYAICRRQRGYEDWHARHVTPDDAIAAGRMSAEWKAQRRRQWGEESAIYQRRVMGNFASDAANVVIPLAWVERAHERWHEWVEWADEQPDPDAAIGRLVSLGADVAGEGAASTVFAPCYPGWKVGALQVFRKQSTMQTTGRIVGILRRESEGLGKGESRPYAMVDVIGLGAGVVSRGRELGYDFRAFNASEGTDARDASREFGFLNVRSAAWWNAREILDPAGGNDAAIPPDDRLTAELTAPRWWVTSNGRIQVEGKKAMKEAERISVSTDYADAVVQSFWRGRKRQMRAY